MSHPQMGSPIKIAFKANDMEGLLQKQGKNLSMFKQLKEIICQDDKNKELDEIRMQRYENRIYF